MIAATRRQTLALAGAAFLPAPARAAAPRLAIVDWAALETALAIGATPIAAAELRQFCDVAVEPAPPASVVDLGLRGAVNYEALAQARPDRILSSNFYERLRPSLARIAPVEALTIYAAGVDPFDASIAAARAIGALAGRDADAESFIAQSLARLDALRAQLAPMAGRSVLPINLGDARHFRVFGRDSMFGAALERLGLRNAWTKPTSYSASAPIGLERLAFAPEAWIAVIDPTPPDAEEMMRASAFWRALPAVRRGRVLRVASVNPFGALPAAGRFARLLSQALASPAAEGGHAG